jgi:hypothetical protein
LAAKEYGIGRFWLLDRRYRPFGSCPLIYRDKAETVAGLIE